MKIIFSKFIVDTKNNRVQASTESAACQLYIENIVNSVKNTYMEKNTWYPINGDYGKHLLENKFPNFKGGEFISVEYLK